MSALPASCRWTAPEILYNPIATESRHSAVTPACDVYSFAMIMWEVAMATDPFYLVTDEHEVTIVLHVCLQHSVQNSITL